MWLLIPILVYTLVFLAVRHVYSYWRRKGFPHEKSELTWIFFKKVYNREFHYVNAICEAYRSGKERFVGIYFLFHPALLIRDLSLARDIMESPCSNFHDPKWDYVRGYRKFNIMEKISAIFSAVRLEAVFPVIDKIGDTAVHYLDGAVTSSGCNSYDMDAHHLLRTYTMIIIANLIYGLEIDLFKQTNSVFHQYLDHSIRPSAVCSYTYNRIPKKSSLTYRLRDVIRENVEKREEGDIVRKDILQVLVKFRNGNDIEQNDKFSWQVENMFDREKLLSINKLAHITENLLENGMTTMSSTAVFTLLEILQQPDLKAKVLDEIRTHLQINDKQLHLTYESLKQLNFIDLCIQETARKYPSVPVIELICRKDFQIPDSKHILSEGKSLMIPLLAIQRDEKCFDDPLSFKPQRFVHNSDANKGNCFISFGLGAKTYKAQDFVKLVVKCVLVKLFLEFHMELVQVKKIEGFRVKLKPTKIKFNV